MPEERPEDPGSVLLAVSIPSKPWWQSRTIWVNVGSASLEILQLVGGVGLIPPGTLTLATGAINIVLRAVTTQPVSSDGAPQKVMAEITADTARMLSHAPLPFVDPGPPRTP